MAPLSDAEKKRRSRARKSAKYHDNEREASRRRMAVYRAKNRAQKRATQLKSLLSREDAMEIEEHVVRQRQSLLGHWFDCRSLKFDPEMINNTKRLTCFMTKVELHKIDLQVAEFEISIIGGGNNNVESLNGLGVKQRAENLAEESSETDLPSTQMSVDINEQRVTIDEIDHHIRSLVKNEMASLMPVVEVEPESLDVAESPGVEGHESTGPGYGGNLAEQGSDTPTNDEIDYLINGDMSMPDVKSEPESSSVGEDGGANPGVEADASMQAFEDDIDEVLAAEVEQDGLFQMSMQDFDVGDGLEIDEGFRANEFLW